MTATKATKPNGGANDCLAADLSALSGVWWGRFSHRRTCNVHGTSEGEWRRAGETEAPSKISWTLCVASMGGREEDLGDMELTQRQERQMAVQTMTDSWVIERWWEEGASRDAPHPDREHSRLFALVHCATFSSIGLATATRHRKDQRVNTQ